MKECKHCGRAIVGKRGNARYCTLACKQSHYYYLAKEQIERQPERTCAYCGHAIDKAAPLSKLYCKRQCQLSANHYKRKEKIERMQEKRPSCRRCGGEIPNASSKTRKYCSKACLVLWHREKSIKKKPRKVRETKAKKGFCISCHVKLSNAPAGAGNTCGWCVEESKMELDSVIKNLPQKKKGERLPGGLGLRVLELEADSPVKSMICSRVEVAPSVVEVKIVAEAVARVWGAEVVWASKKPKEVVDKVGVRHISWQLFWPSEAISTVHRSMVQPALVQVTEEKKVVYE